MDDTVLFWALWKVSVRVAAGIPFMFYCYKGTWHGLESIGRRATVRVEEVL